MPRGVFPRTERSCTIDGCGRKHKALGFCSMHYEFHKRESDPVYRQKAADRMRASRARNVASARERGRRHQLRSKYGLTVEQYERMVDQQGGRCAICRRAGRLHVDHNHNTGEVRGLLCMNCNTGIGHLGDDVEVLGRAIGYLADGWRP